MKNLFFLFIVSLSFNIYAQCNIDTMRKENIFMVHNNWETIYKTDDLENGYLTAALKMIATEDSRDTINVVIHSGMYVYVGNYGEYEMIAPRKITFNFKDNNSLEFTAETMEPIREITDKTYLESFFRLNIKDIETMGSNSLKSIVIWDNRTNQRFTCYPYENLIMEQIKCVYGKLLN